MSYLPLCTCSIIPQKGQQRITPTMEVQLPCFMAASTLMTLKCSFVAAVKKLYKRSIKKGNHKCRNTTCHSSDFQQKVVFKFVQHYQFISTKVFIPCKMFYQQILEPCTVHVRFHEFFNSSYNTHVRFDLSFFEKMYTIFIMVLSYRLSVMSLISCFFVCLFCYVFEFF